MGNYVESIARAILQEVPASVLPEGDVDLLFLFYAVLALARGDDTTAKEVHHAWIAWMTAIGQEHASMVSFEDLPGSVKEEDEPFVRAIRAVASRRGLTAT